MSLPDREREQVALDWVRRLADPEFSCWDAHILWLEEDMRNAEIFDRVSLEMEMAIEDLAPAGCLPITDQVANDNDVFMRRRRLAFGTGAGGLIAASVAALLFVGHPPAGNGGIVTTAPGMSRNIRFADGTTIALNGAGKMRIDGDRSVALLDGEAFFQVAHHVDRPFRLQVGEIVIQDVGTAFDVAKSAEATRVSVREGEIAIDPAAEDIRLTAGGEARIANDGQIIRTTAPQIHAIGGWREGRLVYQGATWTEVVTDLSRTLGISVSAAPSMAGRRFTGVIMLGRDRALTIRRVAEIAGVAAIPDKGGWVLEPR